MHFFYQYFEHFFYYLGTLGLISYPIIFSVAFIESFAFIGALVPGTPVVILFGFLAAHGKLNVFVLIPLCIIGGILGDYASYYLGTKGTNYFTNEKKWLNLNNLEKGRAFFKKHGNKSVFFARFIGFIRPVVPFIAGLSGMDKKAFFFWNVTSSIVWSTLYILLGYFFGGFFRISGLI